MRVHTRTGAVVFECKIHCHIIHSFIHFFNPTFFNPTFFVVAVVVVIDRKDETERRTLKRTPYVYTFDDDDDDDDFVFPQHTQRMPYPPPTYQEGWMGVWSDAPVGNNNNNNDIDNNNSNNNNTTHNIVPCPVHVTGDLVAILQHEEEQQQQQQQQEQQHATTTTSSSRDNNNNQPQHHHHHPRYRDKVQVFDFESFRVPITATLRKQQTSDDEAEDDDDDDDDENDDRHKVVSFLLQSSQDHHSNDDTVNDDAHHHQSQDEESSSSLVSLRHIMNQLQPFLCGNDNDNDDDLLDENYEPLHKDRLRRDQILTYLHDLFQFVVETVVQQQAETYQLYASVLGQPQHCRRHNPHHHHATQHTRTNTIAIRKYAVPNYRSASDQYAMYLHNDAYWTTTTTRTENNKDDESPPPVAMINIWLALNDEMAPRPQNTLVFWETSRRRHTRQSHMLHALLPDACTQSQSQSQLQQQRPLLVYDRTALYWGRFYMFVAGQRGDDDDDGNNNNNNDDDDRVLLHGAMDLPGLSSSLASNDDNKSDVPTSVRRSIELRYTLHDAVHHE